MSTGFFVYGRSNAGLSAISVSMPAYFQGSGAVGVTNTTLTHAPTPNFSIGLGTISNPSQYTKIYVDQSLVNQGGTGYLTDDLLEYNDPKYGVAYYGKGDSSGFGVMSDGELMLTDNLAFISRASGPVRTMTYVQTYNSITLRQRIILTLDNRWTRIWNGNYINRRGSSVQPTLGMSSNPPDMSYYFITPNQNDYILQLNYVTPPCPGITFPVGVADNVILSGNIKRAYNINTDGSYVLSDSTLNQYFLLTQGVGQQNPSTGKTTLMQISNKAIGNIDKLLQNYDFRGLWFAGFGQPGFRFKNCLIDASAMNAYLTYISPGGIGADNAFVLKNVRIDPNDSTYKHLLADNAQDLITSTQAAFPVTGFNGTYRYFVPSQPGTEGDGNFNAFSNPVANTIVSIDSTGVTFGGPNTSNGLIQSISLDITKGVNGGTDVITKPPIVNTNYTILSISQIKIKIGGTVIASSNYTLTGTKSNYTVNWSSATTQPAQSAAYTITYTYVADLPVGLNCIVHPPGNDRFSNSYLIGVCGIGMSFENCKIDGTVTAHKFGMVGQDFNLCGNGQWGQQYDSSGIFQGVRYSAFVNAPQDIMDVTGGYRGFNVLTASGRADGSHVDGTQIGGTVSSAFSVAGTGTYTYPGITIDGEYIDSCARHLDATNFVDPIVNGVTTNPYFLAWAGTSNDPMKMKMQIGGLDAIIYIEMSGGTSFNYGNIEIKNSIFRGSTYSVQIPSPPNVLAYFSQTNPISVATSVASNPGASNKPDNASYRFSGMVIADVYGNKAAEVGFGSSNGTLPSALVSDLVYKVYAYSYSYFSITANNVTGASIGDTFALYGGTLLNSSALPTTIQVTSVDTNNIPTAVNLINPGMYKFRIANVKANTVSISAGGTGYTTGDTITAVGGTFLYPLILTITATSGVVTGLTIVNTGVYSVVPTNPFSVTGGTGTGCKINIASSTALSNMFSPINGTSSGTFTINPILSSYVLSDYFTNTPIDGSASSIGTSNYVGGLIPVASSSVAGPSATVQNSTTGVITGNYIKPFNPGLISVHDNYISDVNKNNAIYINNSNANYPYKPVAVYNIRWLYNAPQYSAVAPDGSLMATVGGSSPTSTLPYSSTFRHLPPETPRNFSVVTVSAIKIRILFSPDTYGMAIPTADGNFANPYGFGQANPSGYEYRISLPSSSVGNWKVIPYVPTALSDGTGRYYVELTTVDDPNITNGISFTLDFHGVNAYNVPYLVPQQVSPLVTASIVMPSS